jgi:hypothetical protein
MDFARSVVRAPDVGDAAAHRRRVTGLCLIHPSLFAAAATGFGLLVWRGRFFVTVAQRSNIETLTIAFFLFFFAYLVSLTARGAWGGLRVGWYRARARLSRDPDRVERAKAATLGAPGSVLPDWEFEGEHKLPIIPEPLGVISLQRSERRVDPLSSMLSALVVVAFIVALIAWFIVRPPWVPGR